MSDGPNDWQRRVWGGPSLAEPLTCDNLDTGGTNECPNCRHPLDQHSVDLGCHVGWGRVAEGCTCPLSLALQHSPKREAEIQ